MRMIWALCLVALFGGAALAGPYEDGLAAAQRGDFAAALRNWKIAADRGDARAQYNIGYMYRAGDGVPQDDAEAARWFLRAARKGLADAQAQIGWHYANGIGVALDRREAVRWTFAAAEQGNTTARSNLPAFQYELAYDYMGGLNGVTQDLALTCMWFRLASENGHGSAAEMVDGACAVLTPGERARVASVMKTCVASGLAECE